LATKTSPLRSFQSCEIWEDTPHLGFSQIRSQEWFPSNRLAVSHTYLSILSEQNLLQALDKTMNTGTTRAHQCIITLSTWLRASKFGEKGGPVWERLYQKSSCVCESLVAVIGMGHPEPLVLFVEKLLTFIRGGMADSRASVASQESSHIVNIVGSRPLSQACSLGVLIMRNGVCTWKGSGRPSPIVDSRWLCPNPALRCMQIRRCRNQACRGKCHTKNKTQQLCHMSGKGRLDQTSCPTYREVS
jgi:hypothetical protein